VIPYIIFAPIADDCITLSISLFVKKAFFGLPVVPAVVKIFMNSSSGTAKKDLGSFCKSSVFVTGIFTKSLNDFISLGLRLFSLNFL
jgi:hypothetical protein